MNHTFPGIVRTSITSHRIMTIVTGILAGISNGLLLIAMVRYRSTFSTSKGAYSIANLAIADLLTGLNSSLWGLNNAFRPPEALGEAIFSISWSSTEASFLTILVMSLERYIAIVFPFKAQVWLSKSRTIKSCVAIWFIAAVCDACMSLSLLIVQFCLTIVFQITILVTMFFNYKIVIKLRERRVILSTSMQSSGARGTRSNVDLPRDHKLTVVVPLLVLILIITVLPYIFALQIILVQRLFTVANKDSKLQLFVHYYYPVKIMNFVFNPIVYAWRLPNYRLALLRTLHCAWKQGALVPRSVSANPVLKKKEIWVYFMW